MKPHLSILVASLLAAAFLCSAGKTRADILENWTTNQVSTNRFSLEFVVYGKGLFVAYGEYSDYGAIVSSEDGKTWTLRNDGGPVGSGSGLSFSCGLAFTGTRFFALGGFGTSAVSTDGINWTVFSHPASTLLRGAASGPGHVAVGDAILGSSDGVTGHCARMCRP